MADDASSNGSTHSFSGEAGCDIDGGESADVKYIDGTRGTGGYADNSKVAFKCDEADEGEYGLVICVLGDAWLEEDDKDRRDDRDCEATEARQFKLETLLDSANDNIPRRASFFTCILSEEDGRPAAGPDDTSRPMFIQGSETLMVLCLRPLDSA